MNDSQLTSGFDFSNRCTHQLCQSVLYLAQMMDEDNRPSTALRSENPRKFFDVAGLVLCSVDVIPGSTHARFPAHSIEYQDSLSNFKN